MGDARFVQVEAPGQDTFYAIIGRGANTTDAFFFDRNGLRPYDAAPSELEIMDANKYRARDVCDANHKPGHVGAVVAAYDRWRADDTVETVEPAIDPFIADTKQTPAEALELVLNIVRRAPLDIDYNPVNPDDDRLRSDLDRVA